MQRIPIVIELRPVTIVRRIRVKAFICVLSLYVSGISIFLKGYRYSIKSGFQRTNKRTNEINDIKIPRRRKRDSFTK